MSNGVVLQEFAEAIHAAQGHRQVKVASSTRIFSNVEIKRILSGNINSVDGSAGCAALARRLSRKSMRWLIGVTWGTWVLSCQAAHALKLPDGVATGMKRQLAAVAELRQLIFNLIRADLLTAPAADVCRSVASNNVIR